MLRVPLYYHHIHVGDAKVDNSVLIDPRISWRLDIPKKDRALGTSIDVMVAMLREDEALLQRCHPIHTLQHTGGPTNIRLSRLPFSPKLVLALNHLVTLPRNDPSRNIFTHNILHIYRSMPRVLHLNSNKVDCRSENLRQLSVELVSDQVPSGLYHDSE